MADRLHYEVDGDDAGASLLCVHGFMSSSLQWQPNVAALSARMRLVRVDLWGHGASPAPDDAAAYEVDHYLAQFRRIRRELGGGPWFVCGQSFGAGIAIRDALAHPDELAGLVITNSRSALNTATADQGRALDREAWQALELRSLPYHPINAKRFPDDLKREMIVVADAIEKQALWHGATTTMRRLSCRDDFSSLKVPTLLVNGRFEKAFQADRDFALDVLPGLEVIDLDGGHSVNVEASDGFDRAVLDFVDSVERRAVERD